MNVMKTKQVLVGREMRNLKHKATTVNSGNIAFHQDRYKNDHSGIYDSLKKKSRNNPNIQ